MSRGTNCNRVTTCYCCAGGATAAIGRGTKAAARDCDAKVQGDHVSKKKRSQVSDTCVYTLLQKCQRDRHLGTRNRFSLRPALVAFEVASVICGGRGSVRFGSVRFGSVRFGSVRFGSVRFGSVRLGSVRFGSARSDSVPFVSIQFD